MSTEFYNIAIECMGFSSVIINMLEYVYVSYVFCAEFIFFYDESSKNAFK